MKSLVISSLYIGSAIASVLSIGMFIAFPSAATFCAVFASIPTAFVFGIIADLLA